MLLLLWGKRWWEGRELGGWCEEVEGSVEDWAGVVSGIDSFSVVRMVDGLLD